MAGAAGTGTKPCTAHQAAKCVQSALYARSVLAAVAWRARFCARASAAAPAAVVAGSAGPGLGPRADAGPGGGTGTGSDSGMGERWPGRAGKRKANNAPRRDNRPYRALPALRRGRLPLPAGFSDPLRQATPILPPSGGIAPQRPRDHVRLPRDHAQIGQGRCIGLLPVLLPVPQGADRHMVARGEFGLRDA